MILEAEIKHLNGLKKSLGAVAKQIILDHSFEIINILKNWQLVKGLDSSGSVVGEYSPKTEEYAQKEGILTPKTPGMPYNFYWTGETIENLRLGKVTQEAYEFTTISAKKKLLESEFGDIFTFTEENNKYVNETILLPELYKHILDNLFP